jgi:hypothetical protein
MKRILSLLTILGFIRANAEDALPKALILGDSISIGYTKPVTDLLKGKVAVSRPKANCGDTRAGLANIDKWIGDEKWSVIHFNWDLHDLCYRNPGSKEQGHRDKVKGTLSVPLQDYEKNLETLVLRLKQTGATLTNPLRPRAFRREESAEGRGPARRAGEKR